MKHGTARLSEVARHVVQPDGIVSTGWPAAERTCAKVGLGFDAWQEGAGRLILAKGADGLYAADTVVLSIPRQVGKTYLIGAIVFALCLIRPGLTVIWTAHRFKTANETFGSMSAMARRQAMRPHVDPKDIHRSGDDKSITFRNGSRVLFGARERGFGRGFADVDVLMLDEAQILTEAAMDDMTPATNIAENPLVILTGTPPRPQDPGEVFRRFRTEALAGESTDVLYVELSADPATDPMDRDEWRRFNPSYPHRTPARAMLRMRKNLSAESFEREARGIWDEAVAGALSFGRWSNLVDATAERGAEVVFGLDLTGDREVWIAVAWRRDDGHAHVMLANDGRPLAAYRAVDECKRLTGEWGGEVATAAFGDEMDREGVPFSDVSSSEFAAACGRLADAVKDGTVRHGNQPALNDAVKAARWRASTATSGERAFVLRDAPEVGPAAAAARALWLLNEGAAYDPLESIY